MDNDLDVLIKKLAKNRESVSEEDLMGKYHNSYMKLQADIMAAADKELTAYLKKVLSIFSIPKEKKDSPEAKDVLYKVRLDATTLRKEGMEDAEHILFKDMDAERFRKLVANKGGKLSDSIMKYWCETVNLIYVSPLAAEELQIAGYMKTA